MVVDDEFETPPQLYIDLCNEYKIYPKLDIAAIEKNSLCRWFGVDSLNRDWVLSDELEMPVQDIWMNCPHSETEEWVKKADEQWMKYGMNILAIIPANSICTKYFKRVFPHVEIHPIFFRPRFHKNGLPSKHHSRNSYFVVIWRKR